MHVKLILGRLSFDVITPSLLIPSLEKAGDKKVFFTVTVNVASRKIQNL